LDEDTTIEVGGEVTVPGGNDRPTAGIGKGERIGSIGSIEPDIAVGVGSNAVIAAAVEGEVPGKVEADALVVAVGIIITVAVAAETPNSSVASNRVIASTIPYFFIFPLLVSLHKKNRSFRYCR
jgi:hypothetical protein